MTLLAGLAACSAPPPDTAPVSGPSGGDPGIAALRNCATVTSTCAGIAALKATAPFLCSDTASGPVCRATTVSARRGSSSRVDGVSYQERLAAMQTVSGTCGLHAIYRDARGFGPGEFAILGIWTTRGGIQQYLRARYLPEPAMAEVLDDPAQFARACAALESRL